MDGSVVDFSLLIDKSLQSKENTMVRPKWCQHSDCNVLFSSMHSFSCCGNFYTESKKRYRTCLFRNDDPDLITFTLDPFDLYYLKLMLEAMAWDKEKGNGL